MVGEDGLVQPGAGIELNALRDHLFLDTVEIVAGICLLGQTPGLGEGTGVDAEFRVPQRLVTVAVGIHDGTQGEAALDERPRQRNTIGVQVHDVEIPASAALINAAGELAAIGHSAGKDQGRWIGLLDRRGYELEHLCVHDAPLAHGHFGLNPGSEEICESAIHFVE
ncbi:MAG: hypothetical protein WAX69_06630 [Victivallales bacterium]